MSLNLFLTIYAVLALVSYILLLIDAKRLSKDHRLHMEDFIIGIFLSFALFGLIYKFTIWLEKRRYRDMDDET